MAETKTVTLILKDNKEIKIELEDIFRTGTLRSIFGWDDKNLEDIVDEDIPIEAIPCTEVDFETFNLIKIYFEWTHHESDETQKKNGLTISLI